MAQVVIFGRPARPGPAALLEGAKRIGMRAVVQRPQFDARDGLIANTTAVFLDGISGHNASLRDRYEAAGVPCYIMELPRLRAASGPDKTSDTRLVGFYRTTLHDLPNRLGNTAVVAGLLEDRDPIYMLVAGQKPDDQSHHMNAAATAQWARETIEFVRQQYGLPVLYRPHPRAVTYGLDPRESYGADAVSLPTEQTLRAALQCAAALVTYNSTSGIDAIDAGVPVLYTAPDELVCYAQYAHRLGGDAIEPSAAERATLLLRLAAQQWTLDQMRSGLTLACLVNGVPWPEAQLVTQTSQEAAERDQLALANAAEILQDAMDAHQFPTRPV